MNQSGVYAIALDLAREPMLLYGRVISLNGEIYNFGSDFALAGISP